MCSPGELLGGVALTVGMGLLVWSFLYSIYRLGVEHGKRPKGGL